MDGPDYRGLQRCRRRSAGRYGCSSHYSVAVQLAAQEAKARARIGDRRQTEVALDRGDACLTPCRTPRTWITILSSTPPSSTSTPWIAIGCSQTTKLQRPWQTK